ncbi:hypothetical protein GWI33_023199 [Rhynchophorus ferrugineus]|uniref:Uncharacterized protein n=1 Tax=Rhynchophorus ferrugineus TaxID=354439 RepID=A0A834HLM4_RHYFE|nr:hypothetical protein GWI33_023199 [Rhynchophorus ferrugineus]
MTRKKFSSIARQWNSIRTVREKSTKGQECEGGRDWSRSKQARSVRTLKIQSANKTGSFRPADSRICP